MTAKAMLRGGLVEKCGKLLSLCENKGRFGLGYKPTKDDKWRIKEEKKEKRLARLENREPYAERVPIRDIRQSFQSAGMMYPDQIAAAEDDCAVNVDTPLVYPCSQHKALSNWEIIEFPMVFESHSK